MPAVPILRTSHHDADFRCGLWDALRDAWPVPSFAEMAPDEIAAARDALLASLNGMITAPAPESGDPDAQRRYELETLREMVLQGSLYSTAQLLVAVEATGYALKHQTRRGQWVQFALYALHAAVRAGAERFPGVDGARLEAELIDGVLRRLAHEVPEAWAVPQAVPAVLAKLRDDFESASGEYAKLPVRWVDETTPAAPWLLARSSAMYLTEGDPDGVRTLAPFVIEISADLLDGIDAEAAWGRLAALGGA